jgi:dolichol-phosphate mannosyltransferase
MGRPSRHIELADRRRKKVLELDDAVRRQVFVDRGRFAAAGLFGALIDALLFQWLMDHRAGLGPSHIMSFLAVAALTYPLISQWKLSFHYERYSRWREFGRFLIVGILTLAVRGGMLGLLVHGWHIPPFVAILPVIAATAGILYVGSAFYVVPAANASPSRDVHGRVLALGIIAFAVVLRLIYIGAAQLIPDEAYYWNYARHMDLSFYDHPPMVAWLIWLGTSIFGDNEFGVRISAFICGLIALGYLYALTRNLYDESTGIRAVLLLTVLPFYFATGALMTADAPLVAAWAATLYYMERALVANRPSSWLGAGIAFGLGILSKYTLGLLGLAALVFMILDPLARRWLRHPYPYLSVLLALLLFSPVIIWNIEHDWVSVLFQSGRIRGVGDDQFGLFELILHLMVLLTPIGLLAAVLALLQGSDHNNDPAYRRLLFMRVFAGVPLAVFLILSIFDTLRFHWTGPLWLMVLPAMARMMGRAEAIRSFLNVSDRVKAAWKPMIAACLLLYSFALHYLVLGIPGIPYQGLYKGFSEHYFWRQATMGIEQIVEDTRHRTGEEPIVVGMTK